MGSEKLLQYFQPNSRTEHAGNDLTGDKKILVRYYADIHLQRFAIGPRQVSPAIPDRLETDVWLSPEEAKVLVNAGEMMIVRDKHGNPIVEA